MHSQPKDITQKKRGHELRSNVNLQGPLNQKGVKQMGAKQELLVSEELYRKNVRSMKLL